MSSHMYPWVEATLSDAEVFDFRQDGCEQILSEASPHSIGTLLESCGHSPDGPGGPPRSRVMRLLVSVLTLHHRLDQPKSPFSAFMEFQDKRTAIGDDWKGCAAVLEALATRAPNPVIEARLYDLAWFVERRRVECGRKAVRAYIRTAQGLLDGTLRHYSRQSDELNHMDVCFSLRRGLQICDILRMEAQDPERVAVRDFVLSTGDAFESGGCSRGLVEVLALASDFDLDDQSRCAMRIEQAARAVVDVGPHVQSDAFVTAASTWRRADDLVSSERCLIEASGVIADHARSLSHAFSSAHFIQEAIELLRGVRSPDAKVAKQDLRIELIRLQAAAEDDFGTFEYPVDLAKVVDSVRRRVQGLEPVDGIFALASIHMPRPSRLIEEEAISSIHEYPLSSLFGIQQYDGDGYVRFRSPGGDLRSLDPVTLEHKVAQQEAVFREFVVRGQISVVLHELAWNSPASEEEVLSLFRASPFVPIDLRRTFSKGVLRYLHGDMTSALAILTPMLEACFLYVLKGHAVEVVRHNEDGTQEEMSITSLYKNLRADLNRIFGEAAVADVDRVFLARSGPGIRHAVAHGTLTDNSPFSPDGIYACWLIVHLALVPLFRGHFSATCTRDSD